MKKVYIVYREGRRDERYASTRQWKVSLRVAMYMLQNMLLYVSPLHTYRPLRLKFETKLTNSYAK